MSECHLEADGSSDYIVIGWDPATTVHPGTFFCVAQLEAVGEEPVLLLGTGVKGDLCRDDPRPLIEAIAKYAPPFDHELAYRELMKDRAENNGGRDYAIDGTKLLCSSRARRAR